MQPNLKAVAVYAKAVMDKDHSGHGFDHIMRVVQMVKLLLTKEPQADFIITLTAAYFHDAVDDKVVADPQQAEDNLKNKLAGWHYSPDQIQAIFAIINHMSYSANLTHHYHLTLEGQIVQDADRLDAIGAIGIVRAAYYSGHIGETIYDPAIKPRLNLNKKEYRNHHGTLINHFYEKLFKLKDEMNLTASKQIAEQRQKIMQRFVCEFKAEWQGKY